MRIPSAWKEPLTQGRLLILSPFESKYRRVTATLAEERNHFVVALSDKVFVAYATAGGKTEQLCQQILDTGKPLYTLDLNENDHLMKAGAIGVAANDVRGFLANS
jgi:predicted Rossmann fold nucleotide-binding protein DprA/Smf involved in DNA uptake